MQSTTKNMGLSELRQKKLYETWKPIQAKRENLDKSNKEYSYHKKKVRELGQSIPKQRKELDMMLNEFDKVMI